MKNKLAIYIYNMIMGFHICNDRINELIVWLTERIWLYPINPNGISAVYWHHQTADYPMYLLGSPKSLFVQLYFLGLFLIFKCSLKTFRSTIFNFNSLQYFGFLFFFFFLFHYNCSRCIMQMLLMLKLSKITTTKKKLKLCKNDLG